MMGITDLAKFLGDGAWFEFSEQHPDAYTFLMKKAREAALVYYRDKEHYCKSMAEEMNDSLTNKLKKVSF